MRNVLATDFGIWPILQNMGQVSDSMLATGNHWKSLANYILMYDQVVIPTGNLQILPVLRIMLGEDIFDELIKNNVIVLARYNKWPIYGGNGSGLLFINNMMGKDMLPDPENMFHNYFKPLDEAIDTALSVTNPSSTPDRKRNLTNLLLDNVISVSENIDPLSFKNETYEDILKSPYLVDFLSLRNKGRSLSKLKGINSNQMVIYSPHTERNYDTSPEIWSVLRVAFENFLLGIASNANVVEITGDDSSLALLKAKGQRAGMAIEGAKAFTKIQQLNGIPDIGEAFYKKQITSEQLLDLRESKHSQAFRDWFGGDFSENADDIVNRYVDSLGKPGLIDSLPIKVLRFATTTAIGASNTIAGAASGALDNFLLSKWFPGRHPKLFLKHAKTIMLKSQIPDASVTKPKMSGRDRNRPCSCGSGKKFKCCCGR